MNHRTTPCYVKPLRVIGAVIGGLFLIAFFALALGAVVMVLWNWLMPSLFGLGAITYWQGFGILVLAQLLFGSHISGHRNEHKYRHDHPPIPRDRCLTSGGPGREKPPLKTISAIPARM